MNSRSHHERLQTRVNAYRNRCAAWIDERVSYAFPHKQVEFSQFGVQLSFTVFRGDHIGKQLQQKRFYEDDLLAVVKTLVPTGGLFVDAGAFIGNHSVFFSAVCKAHKVIAIEPALQTYDLLCKNLAANCVVGTYETYNSGVGCKAGMARLLPMDRLNRGGQMLDSCDSGTCEITTIDQLVGDRSPTLIKIDVEGLAFEVVQGAMETIHRTHPLIIAEALTEDDRKVADILTGLGYKMQGPFCATPTFIFTHPSTTLTASH